MDTDIESFNPYYLPDDVYGVILINFQKMHDIRDLIQLSIVSKLFRDTISKIILTIESLNKNVMKFLKDEQLRMFKGLKILDLSHNEVITNKGIEDLCLNELNLSINNLITDNAIEKMPIHTLNINYNKIITGRAIKTMDLHELYLWNNEKITDDDIKDMKNLHTIELGRNRIITDNGIKNLPLHTLYLSNNNKITKEGICKTPLKTALNLTNGNNEQRDFVANQTEEI